MADVFFSDTINNGTTVGLRANFVSPRRRAAHPTKLSRILKSDFTLFLVAGCASLALKAVAFVSA
jgi:hypothetical protein